MEKAFAQRIRSMDIDDNAQNAAISIWSMAAVLGARDCTATTNATPKALSIGPYDFECAARALRLMIVVKRFANGSVHNATG